jgi:hypothetical protein
MYWSGAQKLEIIFVYKETAILYTIYVFLFLAITAQLVGEFRNIRRRAVIFLYSFTYLDSFS